VPLLVVLCEADEATTRARLERRARDPRAVSDADLEVWRRARERFEPPRTGTGAGAELVEAELLAHPSGKLAAEELAIQALERLAARCQAQSSPLVS